MCLSKKTRPIPRLLNKRTGDSHYHWTKKWGAGHWLNGPPPRAAEAENSKAADAVKSPWTRPRIVVSVIDHLPDERPKKGLVTRGRQEGPARGASER